MTVADARPPRLWPILLATLIGTAILVTLGISIILENLALYFFRADTRTIDTAYTLTTLNIFGVQLALTKVVSFVGALVLTATLLLVVGKTRLGRAQFGKLKVYAGESHPHEAQAPVAHAVK